MTLILTRNRASIRTWAVHGASALALGCGLLTAAPAQAATSGQQISFCSQDPSVCGTPGGYTVATGTNQNGEVVG